MEHRPRIFVATYFGELGDALPVLLDTPVEAIGLDLVAGPGNLHRLAAAGPWPVLPSLTPPGDHPAAAAVHAVARPAGRVGPGVRVAAAHRGRHGPHGPAHPSANVTPDPATEARLTAEFGLDGTAIGAAAAFLGARAAVRVADLIAAPLTILVGLLAATISGPGLTSILATVCVVGWTPFARQAYHLTFREAGRDYVAAARWLGAGLIRLPARHIAPNITGPMVTHLLLRFAGTLLTVSGLSFLGLGVQPPTPQWGAMVAEGRGHLFTTPHLVLAPAVAVVLTATWATVLGRRLER